jgi:hypothetical protein
MSNRALPCAVNITNPPSRSSSGEVLDPRALQFVNNIDELINRPVEITGRNHKRWRQTNDGLVRFLREHAFREQALTNLARSSKIRVDLRGGPETGER